MGNNTTVHILNDHIPNLAKFPGTLVEEILRQLNLSESMREWPAPGLRVQGVTVMTNAPSSSTALIAAGGNHFTVVYRSDVQDQPHHHLRGQVALLRQWAKKLGYRVVKKP